MELNKLRRIRVELTSAKPNVEDNMEKPFVDKEDGSFDMMTGDFADYPWESCIADQTKAYGSKDIAERVCGKIKSENS
jgi:hypothetical protein